jgi:hypothetical protein
VELDFGVGSMVEGVEGVLGVIGEYEMRYGDWQWMWCGMLRGEGMNS